MLRINLLPTYLEEQKRLRAAIIGAVLLFLAVTIGMLVYHFAVLQQEFERTQAAATKAAEDRKYAEGIRDQAASERAKVQPIKDKVDFVKQVRFHNDIRPRLFANAARYTDPKVEYDAMSVTGDTFTVNAYVRSLADLTRFYLTMFNNPDFTAVSIQGIPGWPNAASINSQLGVQTLSTWFPVQLTAKVVRPVVTPTLPGSLSGAGTGTGGFPGAPGFGGPPGFGPGAGDPGSAPVGGAGGAPTDAPSEDR